MRIKNAWIKTKNTDEDSLIVYSYLRWSKGWNHLMFMQGEKLVFKVWLKKTDFKTKFEAAKSVGIRLVDEEGWNEFKKKETKKYGR